MQVTVWYSAQARQAAGASTECVEMEGPCSVRELLLRLSRKHGAPLGRLLLTEQGTLHPSLLLFVGDDQVGRDASQLLKPGDELSILLPVAGGMTRAPTELSDEERAVYEWQMWVPDFGAKGQQALKGAAVLISRCGGVGGAVAYALAAAGVGRLVLAHAGNIKASDLNRQLLMTHAGVGSPRVESAARRLRELNPRVQVEAVAENLAEENAARLVGGVDLVVDCAPLFPERFLMNREAVRQRKPIVHCAVYELEAQLTTIVPGQTPCLACLYPEEPPAWRRQFPVIGAVAHMIGSLAALEAIKMIASFGTPLLGKLLACDLREMSFRTLNVRRNPDCPVCAS